jgi:hypothetical protein
MRLLLLAAASLSCACTGNTGGTQPRTAEPVRLENRAIVEASGLARSHYYDDRLWTLNDGGSSPALYAFFTDGRDAATVRLRGADNIDWEDLASFSLDGRHWLVVGDVGDNAAGRSFVTLYVAEEPQSTDITEIEVAREIRLRYPDGPMDCEAIAVDVAGRRVLLLGKRTIPAVLYAVPLTAQQSDEPLLAERLGVIDSIPQPTGRDLRRALPNQDWHWQPTAMDLSDDGSLAAVLTYRAVYLFSRSAAEPWIAALQREPVQLPIGNIREAESIAISRDGGALFVTAEGRHPPLLRLKLAQ